MNIELHYRLTDPLVTKATRVLVRDQFGQPVALVTEPFPGRIDVLKAGDQGFEEALAQVGVFALAPAARAEFPPRVAV